jgi:type II secretory pathway component PulK
MPANQRPANASSESPLLALRANATNASGSEPRRGVVLIAVLVVVAVLAFFAYNYADMATADYSSTHAAVRTAQARHNAASGVHYIAALLSSPENVPNLPSLTDGSLFDNPAWFQDRPVRVSDIPGETGKFSVFSFGDDGKGVRFGLVDENSKIDLNALVKMDKNGKIAHDLLIKLPNMTEEIVDAIIDWIDTNATARPAGCESDYYLGLDPPYKAKNGPLDSLEELLLVRGVTAPLLFGNDKNRNGILDTDENDDGHGVLGWSAYLTVYSRENNIAKDAVERININDADLAVMFEKLLEVVDEEMAAYIALLRTYGPYKAPTKTGMVITGGDLLAYNLDGTISGAVLAGELSAAQADALYFVQATGGSSSAAPPSTSKLTKSAVNTKSKPKNSITSLFDLVNSYVEVKPASGKGKSTYYGSPLNDPAKAKELLPKLFDKTTTSKEPELAGRINVNSAPEAVLRALPELTEDDVNAIINIRPAPGTVTEEFDTLAWLVTEAGLKPETLSKVEKYITTTSQVFRLQVLGYFDGGGPTARIEAVIDTNGGRPRIVHWRDLSELGKGFEMAPSGQ